MSNYDEEVEKSKEEINLEDEFKVVCNSHMAEIEAKLDIAQAALQEAIDLSDKYGIPFYSNVSQLGQPYTPPSFYQKFPDLDGELAYNLTSVSIYNGNYGWQTSSLC
jgi:cell division protein FtsI/penicillin-binding protein 2